MRPNIPEETGIQLDQGRASTDDFITRTYVLPLLSDPATRARLIEEHRINPVGKPGKAGKAGVGHSPVKILEDESYPSEDACEHAIFVKRVHDLLALYGYDA